VPPPGDFNGIITEPVAVYSQSFTMAQRYAQSGLRRRAVSVYQSVRPSVYHVRVL